MTYFLGFCSLCSRQNTCFSRWVTTIFVSFAIVFSFAAGVNFFLQLCGIVRCWLIFLRCF